MANLAATQSSVRMNWRTPEHVLERVSRVFPIELDPCASSARRHHFAMVNWTVKQDGLSRSWMEAADGGMTFVNPPYGDHLDEWLSKCADEGRAGTDIIALVPARTDTRWFQHCWTARAICFWKGRIKFIGAKNGAPFPSCLPYWGSDVKRFTEAFSDAGHIVVTTGAP